MDTLALVVVSEDEVAEGIAGGAGGLLPVLDRGALLLGYVGLYSSFPLHARRAAASHGVAEGDLLLALGRHRPVGGQEDLITSLALEIAADRGESSPLARATSTRSVG